MLEEQDKADYTACMLGLRDYVEKNRFPGWCSAFRRHRFRDLRGARGGCPRAGTRARGDAALSLHLRRQPHGCEGLRGALGIRYDILPIASAVEGWKRRWRPLRGTKRDITEENVQSRARGTILMSISNKFGPMVVTTGNKSEMSVGYATLYGDMNGGFNPIKDLYKMEVYRLSALRNRWKPEGARARMAR